MTDNGIIVMQWLCAILGGVTLCVVMAAVLSALMGDVNESLDEANGTATEGDEA